MHNKHIALIQGEQAAMPDQPPEGRRYQNALPCRTAGVRPAESAGPGRNYRACPAYFPLVRKVRGGAVRHNIS